MTWTVFKHNHGDNETEDFAPGRGGYSTVLVEADSEAAMEWWAEEYGEDPHRYTSYPDADHVWSVEQYEDPEGARKQCGKLAMERGGVGSPMKRLYSWDELRGRLDVQVVEENEVRDG